MHILQPHNVETGWITAVIENRWVQAKVYDEPSDYGINNGRVSKLVVGKTSTRDPQRNFFEQMCYNYDRGLDFDRAPKGLIDKIVAQLETLPRLFPEVQEELPKEKLEQQPVEQKLNITKKGRFNL